MRIEKITLGRMRTHAYLVADDTGADALLIDAPEAGEALVAAVDAWLTQHGLRLAAVVATHSHWDHVGGIAAIQARYGVPFWIGEHAVDWVAVEAERALTLGYTITPPPAPDRGLAEGEVIALGGLRLEVLNTPGHWHGDISLWEQAQGVIFSGDTVFREDIGAYNKGCDIPLLVESIRTKLLTKPDETILYAGHGRVTTVGHERQHNRWLVPG